MWFALLIVVADGTQAAPDAGSSIRRRPVTEADLQPEGSRDPFRRVAPLAIVPAVPESTRARTYPLGELKLVAVIGGDVPVRAMFVTPRGRDVIVRRGDFLSSSDARIAQILSDRVILEVAERLDDGVRLTQRVLVLHQDEGPLRFSDEE